MFIAKKSLSLPAVKCVNNPIIVIEMRQLIIISIFITGLSLLACSHKMSGSIATASVVQDTIDPSKVDKVIDYSIKQEFKSAKQLSQLICDTWSKRINEKPSYSLKRCMDARDESHVLDSLNINLVGDTIYMYEFDDLVDGFSAFYWNSRNEFDVLPRNGEASMSAERSEYEFYPNLKMGIEKWNKKFLSRPQRKVSILGGYGPQFITRVIIKKGKIKSIGTVALRDYPQAWEPRSFN